MFFLKSDFLFFFGGGGGKTWTYTSVKCIRILLTLDAFAFFLFVRFLFFSFAPLQKDILLRFSAKRIKIYIHYAVFTHPPTYSSLSILNLNTNQYGSIYPGHSYRETLYDLGCPRLDERLDNLCKKTT